MTKVDSNIQATNAGWTFAGIANDFEAHAAKSIPLYREGHDLICKYSDFFVKNDSKVVEIGCSTGALTRKLFEWHKGRTGTSIIGIDTVPDMVDFASQNSPQDPRLRYVCEDVLLSDLSGSDMIVSYYVIQFIPPRVRQEVFNRIYQSLNWGGAFFMFEKVRAPDARFQDYAAQIYNDFKLDQGLSEENIVNKTRSLKGALEPFSTGGNTDMLRRAGFSDIMSIQKWVCFEGFLAVK